MNLPITQLVQSSPRAEWLQILALFTIGFFFVLHGTGILLLGGAGSLGISLDTSAFFAPDEGFFLPVAVRSWEFLILSVGGLVLAFALPLISPLAASALVVLLALPSLYLAVAHPFRVSPIPMQYNLLVLMVLFGVNVLLEYFTATRQKQELLNVFGRFVPPEIVQDLSRRSEMPDLGGDARELTILFSDLKNFTGLSEQLDPRQLVQLLNQYFTAMTSILLKHGATIDKYIGDSVMAFWSAPVPQEDHARRAVAAAAEMHNQVDMLSRRFLRAGWPTIDMGVGINTGVVNVGNMGSVYRMAYTAIGDPVNLCARLEAMTRIYQVPTIVGPRTVEQAKEHFLFRELDTVLVKGKTSLSKVYQPLMPLEQADQTTREMLERHQQALELMYRQEYREAEVRFAQMERDYPSDTAYYELMRDKAARGIGVQEVDDCPAESSGPAATPADKPLLD